MSEAAQRGTVSTATREIGESEPWVPHAVAIVALLLVATPLLTVTVASFRPGLTLPFQAGSWTVHNFVEVFGAGFTYRLLLNTFVYAIASLALGLSIALTLAWLVERTDMPYANSVYMLVLIPMAVPILLQALGWVLLLGPRQGIINLFIRDLMGLHGSMGPLNIYTFTGMVFLTGLAVVPTMFIMLGPLLRNVDPSLEEAAATSGVGMLTTLRKITLPLVWPGILAVTISFLIIMIEFFEIPLVIGLNAEFPVLSLEIFTLVGGEQHLPQYGLASTYSFLGLALGILLLYQYRRATANAKKYEVVTGKGYRRERVRLGRAKYLAGAVVMSYLLVTVVLPLGVLLWSSLLTRYQPPSRAAVANVTLANYMEIFRDARIVTAAGNTVVVLAATATCVVGLAVLIAWVINRYRPPFAGALDNVVFLPLAVPGVVIALGVMLFYIRTPLWGTVWIIVVGHVIRFLPFSTRMIGAAILQVQQELEEAAWASGVSRLVTLRRVTLPLLLPALGNTWLWVAVHSMRDFTFPLMLTSYTNVVIASVLWQLWQYGEIPKMAALAVLMIAASVLFTVGSRRVALGVSADGGARRGLIMSVERA